MKNLVWSICKIDLCDKSWYFYYPFLKSIKHLNLINYYSLLLILVREGQEQEAEAGRRQNGRNGNGFGQIESTGNPCCDCLLLMCFCCFVWCAIMWVCLFLVWAWIGQIIFTVVDWLMIPFYYWWCWDWYQRRRIRERERRQRQRVVERRQQNRLFRQIWGE